MHVGNLRWAEADQQPELISVIIAIFQGGPASGLFLLAQLAFLLVFLNKTARKMSKTFSPSKPGCLATKANTPSASFIIFGSFHEASEMKELESPLTSGKTHSEL